MFSFRTNAASTHSAPYVDSHTLYTWIWGVNVVASLQWVYNVVAAHLATLESPPDKLSATRLYRLCVDYATRNGTRDFESPHDTAAATKLVDAITDKRLTAAGLVLSYGVPCTRNWLVNALATYIANCTPETRPTKLSVESLWDILRPVAIRYGMFGGSVSLAESAPDYHRLADTIIFTSLPLAGPRLIAADAPATDAPATDGGMIVADATDASDASALIAVADVVSDEPLPVIDAKPAKRGKRK